MAPLALSCCHRVAEMAEKRELSLTELAPEEEADGLYHCNPLAESKTIF